MPLPLILGAGAVIAGLIGVGNGIHGGIQLKNANDIRNEADIRNKRNNEMIKTQMENTNIAMDELGKLELEILEGFKKFSDTIEKIQNRPEFEEYSKDNVELPKYNRRELENVSTGAGVLVGALGGAAVGTAGGFAAAGATSAAVAALGTASTGTAISSLSGAAAANATLAALGGGSLAAGGGGIALGTTILGASTLGVGLLIGGVIFNIVGGKISDKADEAWKQMIKAEKKINDICKYLKELSSVSRRYKEHIEAVNKRYEKNFFYISYVVNDLNKTNWNTFSEDEKRATKNSVLLVALLNKMCKVNLVNKTNNKDGINDINREDIGEAMHNAHTVLKDLQ